MELRRKILVMIMALGIGTICASGADAPPSDVGRAKSIIDFEDASIWKSENNSPFEVSTEHVTQGKKSLKVNYTNKPEWSNILTDKMPADWTGFRYLNVDVFLEGQLPAEFGIWIRDKAFHKAESSFILGPGANTLTIDLDDLKNRLEFDRGNVIAMCLYKNSKEEITVYLDNMCVSEKAPVLPKAEPVKIAPDKELVVNGSFEDLQAPDALGNPFKWWNARRWSGASFLGRGEKAVYSGSASAMLDGRGPCKIGFFSPLVPVKCPTRLKLTAYVQADGLKKGQWGNVASIGMTDAGERGLADAGVALPEGTYAWKKAEVVFDVPDKCYGVKIFIQLYGQGRLWVDDVSLKGTDLDAKCGWTLTDTGRELKVDPPLVTGSPEQSSRRAEAEKALAELKAVVAEAKT